MKIKVSRGNVLMLEQLKGKLLLGDNSTLYIIKNFKVEKEVKKHMVMMDEEVEYLTSCEIEMYFWRGKFVALLTPESVETMLIMRDMYKMRQYWLDFREQLQHFGLDVVEQSALNMMEKAFEAGREYQEYKSNANLEEKSWDYTFAKWCEKQGISVTKS